MLLTTSRAKNGKKIYKTRLKVLIRKESRKSYDEHAINDEASAKASKANGTEPSRIGSY